MTSEQHEKVNTTARSLEGQEEGYRKIEGWVSENLLKRLNDRHLISHSTSPTSAVVTSLNNSIQAASTLWGVGFDGDDYQEFLKIPAMQSEVTLTRGPWTAALLVEAGFKVAPRYGDPALLVSSLFPEFEFSAVRRSTGILIAVGSDLSIKVREKWEDEVTLLDPNGVVSEQVEMIVGAELVISTSVTIVAIAESFGIPARFINPNDDFGMYFRQRDYLAGTDRPYEIIVNSIDETITLGGFVPVSVDFDAIRDSFPKHLWTETQKIETANRENANISRQQSNLPSEMWVRSIQDRKLPVEKYVELLEALPASDQQLLSSKIDRLSGMRLWLEPNLDVSDASYEVRALDYMVRMNPGKVSELLAVQSTGLNVTLYSVLEVDCGSLVSLVLRSPKILDEPVSLELNFVKAGKAITMPIPAKTVRVGQITIDIDVVLEDILTTEVEDARAVLYFEEESSISGIVKQGPAPWSVIK